tara:strand:- start:262 stop:474 length:213 start_codon:yes stop_codon:yes gene_type:complete
MTDFPNTEINDIYGILADLEHNSRKYSSINPNAIEVAKDFYSTKLRSLQESEANIIQRNFLEGLSMPLGE